MKSNLYVRIPAHIVHDRGNYAEDPVVVAAHLAKPYFFSYHTALAIHGLAQQAASRVFLSTTRQVNPVSYKGSVIRAIRLDKKRFFGFEKTESGAIVDYSCSWRTEVYRFSSGAVRFLVPIGSSGAVFSVIDIAARPEI